MLPSLQTSIARLLTQRGGFAPDEVEVRFERPTRDWAETLLRPTLNCFLIDISEQTDLRNNTMQATQTNGRVVRRMPPRRYNLRYVVSAWSSESSDESVMLWRTLATLTRFTPFPNDLLEAELRQVAGNMPTSVGRYDEAPGLTDLWSALQVPPRAALFYTVIAPLDLEITLESPLVLSTSLRTNRSHPSDEREGEGLVAERAIRDREARFIGGVVRRAGGLPVRGARITLNGGVATATDAEGRYTLPVRGSGPLTLIITAAEHPTQTIELAEDATRYDIELG